MKVFLSSTYTDMIESRKIVLNYLGGLSINSSAMEVWGAFNQNPLDVCLQNVKDSDLYIGIIGHRYGSIDEKSGKSITELEYLTALDSKVDRLIFIMSDEYSISAKHFDTGDNYQKLKEFKEKLKQNRYVAFYDNLEELYHKLDVSLKSYFGQRGIIIDNFSMDAISQSIKEANFKNQMPDDIRLDVSNISDAKTALHDLKLNIEGLKSFYDYIKKSYDKLDSDIIEIISGIGVSKDKISEYLSQQNLSFGMRDWEMITFFPNRILHLEKSYLILYLHILQFEAKQKPWNERLTLEISIVRSHLEELASSAGYID